MSNRLTVELDLNLQRAKKQISELAETGTNLGLNEKDLKRVTELEKRVDDLGKTLKDLTNITNNKVNTKQFTDATKKIQESINQLQKNFDSMASTLSALDKVQFTHSMEDAVDAATGLTMQVNNVATAVHTLQQNFDDLRFVDIKDKKELKDTLKLYEEIESTLYNIKKINTSRKKNEGDLDYFNRLYAAVSKYKKEYDQYILDIDEFEGDKESKEFLELQKNMVSAGQAIKEVIKVIEELSKTSDKFKLRPFEKMQLDGISLDYIRKDINEEFDEIANDITSNIERISGLIQKMDVSELTEAQGKTAKANKQRTSKGIATSLYISTNPNTLKKQVTTLLDFVQASIDPIDVEVRLTSKYTNKRFNEEFKKLANDVEQLTIDPDIKTTFLEDMLAIKSQLEKEATLSIKTDVSAAEQEIWKVLGRIRKELNKSQNRLHVSPDVEIPKSKIKQIQTELNKLAKELTLKLDHVVISDKAIQEALDNKNKKNKLIDANTIANTATLANLIDKIVQSNQEFINSDNNIKESLLEIKNVIETISVDSIVNPLKELVYILSRFTGVLSKSDLDQMFDGMRADIEDITGSLKDKTNLQAIKDLLNQFNQYRLAGGDRDISELGGEKNVQKWLKKNFVEETSFTPNLDINYNNIVDQASKGGVEAGKSFSNEYAQGIREGIPEVENAAKELVNAAVNSINRTQGTENGNNYGDGYSEGIKDTEAKAENAGANLAEAARKGTAEAQDSHSPSKVAEKLGEYWGEGYANGILNTSTKIKNAIRALVEEGVISLKDIAEDTVHTNESDLAFNDLIDNKTARNKSYRQHIVDVNNNDVVNLLKQYDEAILQSVPDLEKIKELSPKIEKLLNDKNINSKKGFSFGSDVVENIKKSREELDKLLSELKSKKISEFTIEEIEEIDSKFMNLRKTFNSFNLNDLFIDWGKEKEPIKEVGELLNEWAEIQNSKFNESDISLETDEVKTFLNAIELLKNSKVYDGIENVEERIQRYVEGIKSGLIDAEDALQDFVNHSTFDPDINATQEADKVVKAENKKQKAKKDTKKATEDTIATQQKEKTELEDTSAIDKYQTELNQSERSLLDFTGALGENSLAITEQEKLLAQLTKGKAFPDTAYQGLFRMSNGKDESKKAIANELLGLYTDFGNFLDTDTLNEIWSKTKNSDLSKKMKNSIMKYISKIAKELKEGLEQGVQEASTELQPKKTKTITMSKSEYKDYVKKNKLVPLGKNGEAFEHNFEMQLRGLQEKGLATQKINKNGSKGRWIIQVEVEDNGELKDINKQIEDTKSKTKDLSKTQKTIKDTSKAIKQLSNETEELTKEEQEYLNQQEKKRLDSEQNIGTTLTEIEKTKEVTKAKQEQAKAEKELANAKEKSNTINKESDISPIRQAGRNIGSELAKGIRDTTDQVKESAELSKIIKETGEQAESASKGKDKFTESNKQVKESAENSINSLSEEAKLFKEIGDNSKEAAKGKTEFTKANKDVKKSTDNTTSSKSKEKDKEEYDVKEAKKRQKQIEKLVSKTQSELDEGVISSVDRSYDSHGYLVQALIRLEKAVQEDENLVKRIERINVRYDKEGGIAYTSTQTSDDYTYGDKVEEKRAKSEEKIRKEQEKQEQKDIEAQNQARINLINEMADGRIKAEINARNREYEAERKQAEAINKALQKDWEDNQRELANAMAKGREEEKKKREKAEADAIKQSEKERQSDLKLNDDLGNAQSKMKTLQITLENQGRYVGTLKEKYDELSQSLSMVSTPEQLTRWKALLDVFKELDKQDKILNGYTNGKAKELENVQKTYQNLLTKDDVYKNQFNEAFLSDKGIDEVRSKITEISNLINELREKTNIEYVDDDEKKKLETLIQEHKEYVKVLEKNEKIANDNSRAKLLKKITDALKENTKYSRKAKVELDGYRDQLKNTVITASDLSKIGTRFLEIQEAEKAAGREGDNFFTKVIKRAKNMSASFLGMYLSLYDIIRYAREAFGVIQQLDTALVDLRKTTTMTSSELEDFYYNSSNLAKQMGVTSEEIINQAAAWSRLNKIGLLYGNV